MIINKEDIPAFSFRELRMFSYRTVLIDGKNSGEYHIKSNTIEPGKLRKIIQGFLDDSDVSLVDPENILKLEWPIAVKVNSVLVNEMIDDYFGKVDTYLCLMTTE